MKLNYNRIGDFIRKVNVRNTELKVTNLMGINIDKYFMPSVANTVGTDMSKYKIVRNGQFACNRMHVGRDKRLPVSLSKEEAIIVSPAYDVFEIVDEEILDPDYLMMCFLREEFDRIAWFYTDADVRGGLKWEDFCNIQIPVPTIVRQKEIVKEYSLPVNRININTSINQKLKEVAHAIYREWFINFEFPDENGNPYKSNGGELKESVMGEIPKTWEVGQLLDLFELQRGFDLPTQERIEGAYPIFASTGITGKHNEFKVKGPGVVTGRSGSLGEVFYVDEDFWPLNTTLWVKKFNHATPIFSYYVLSSINMMDYNSGSAVPTLNRNHIHLHPVIIPNKDTIRKFESIIKSIFSYKKLIVQEEDALDKLKNILLSKLATKEVSI